MVIIALLNLRKMYQNHFDPQYLLNIRKPLARETVGEILNSGGRVKYTVDIYG